MWFARLDYRLNAVLLKPNGGRFNPPARAILLDALQQQQATIDALGRQVLDGLHFE